MSRHPEPEIFLRAHRATYSFYLGDCLDILDRLPPASIDVIVTSPRYNLGIPYRTYDDTIPRDEYLRFRTEPPIARIRRPFHRACRRYASGSTVSIGSNSWPIPFSASARPRWHARSSR